MNFVNLQDYKKDDQFKKLGEVTKLFQASKFYTAMNATAAVAAGANANGKKYGLILLDAALWPRKEAFGAAGSYKEPVEWDEGFGKAFGTHWEPLGHTFRQEVGKKAAQGCLWGGSG